MKNLSLAAWTANFLISVVLWCLTWTVVAAIYKSINDFFVMDKITISEALFNELSIALQFTVGWMPLILLYSSGKYRKFLKLI